ncbi:MAG TPA: type II toxin-antitoxin system HicB family antitoxin [bacterium]|nr:type II toxin-antitoxin system HicB family antitoxin [bacterium]
MKHKYQMIIERDDSGKYIAQIPCLCACYAQGDTPEEAVENCKDVLEMCIEDIKQNGGDAPVQCRFVRVEEVEVEL